MLCLQPLPQRSKPMRHSLEFARHKHSDYLARPLFVARRRLVCAACPNASDSRIHTRAQRCRWCRSCERMFNDVSPKVSHALSHGGATCQMEPLVGFEPTTYSLRMNCSTPELQRRLIAGTQETKAACNPQAGNLRHSLKSVSGLARSSSLIQMLR